MRSALLALASLFLLLPSAVHAQTPPPSATPTPTSGAMALLTSMQKAVSAIPSVHYVLSVKAVDGKKAITMSDRGALSLPAQSVQVSSNTKRRNLKTGRSATEKGQMKVVESRGAWRAGAGSWQCEDLTGTSLSGQILALELQPKSALLVGTATDGTTPVQRLQVKGTLPAWTSNQTDTVTVDIAQGTNLPVSVRFSAATTWGRDREKITVQETYGSYGRPLSISLPKKCRG